MVLYVIMLVIYRREVLSAGCSYYTKTLYRNQWTASKCVYPHWYMCYRTICSMLLCLT